ncbi:uncharacterized protein LOC131064460 isoform X2 [Cryptomeria japonica]|uniref:uncharacterized protein LOC131064460 isoform X2 n=1 Tax=Cryptomeria japonica TaxID=3369 RepID=UPI0027DAAB40|nr:uncharacterized protein LOC131064460 isoform X2 [Cryptomeria japonica]
MSDEEQGQTSSASTSSPAEQVLPFQMYPPFHHQSGGIYAVPYLPFGGGVGTLIPLTYNMPTFATGIENAQSDSGRDSLAEAREAPPEGLHEHHGAPARDAQGQRNDNQRQMVRRFQVGFQLDLLLILKLAIVVFVFNQDGSKERLFLLLSLATLVYLYQTGALAPLLQWISESAQRVRLPPQPPARVVNPQHVARAEGLQEAGNEPNAQNVERQGPQDVDIQEVGNGLDGPADRVNQGAGDPQGLNWWGFMKEVQMIVVGFVMSLLPGFHHHAD